MNYLENIIVGTAQAQEAGTAANQPKGGAFGMFLPMILVFAIFYFLMIRPQQKQRKQHQTLLEALKKGDEVVTTSGIHGKIYGIVDSVVNLEIADNLRIKIDRSHIANVKPAKTPETS